MGCRLLSIFTTLAALGFLSACSSFAKGVTEAVLESGEQEDTRQCHLERPPSVGLAHYLEDQDRDRVQDRDQLHVTDPANLKDEEIFGSELMSEEELKQYRNQLTNL